MWDHPGCVNAQPIPLNRFQRAELAAAAYFGKPSGRKMHHDSDEWAMLLKRMMLDTNRWQFPRESEFLFTSFFFFLEPAVSRADRMNGFRVCVITLINFLNRKLVGHTILIEHCDSILYTLTRARKYIKYIFLSDRRKSVYSFTLFTITTCSYFTNINSNELCVRTTDDIRFNRVRVSRFLSRMSRYLQALSAIVIP